LAKRAHDRVAITAERGGWHRMATRSRHARAEREETAEITHLPRCLGRGGVFVGFASVWPWQGACCWKVVVRSLGVRR